MLAAEICYNGIDDNGDGLIDGKDPLCKIIIVTTTSDNIDGDVSSVENLIANQGIDGEISLREAIAATQSLASRDTFHVVGFSLLNYDLGHFYYKDDGIIGQVSEANKIRTTASDDSAIFDKDPDYPRSWFQFNIHSPLPTLSNNVMVDGYNLRQAQMNNNAFGGALNTVIRIEIVANGNFPVLNIDQSQSADNQVVIRGLSLHGSQEVINVNSGTKGNIWLYGNYIGIDPTALKEQRSTENIITIKGANRPIIIGSNNDGNNDNGEINLISGAVSRYAAIYLENTTKAVIRKNYFGVGLKGNDNLGGNDGIAISTYGGNNNNFDNNVISFYENAFDLYQSKKDSVQNNLIGVHSEDLANLVMTNTCGSCSECEEVVIIGNTIANSRSGWNFYQTIKTHFIKNKVFGHLSSGVTFVDESVNSVKKNKENFIFKNEIHHNLIGILLGLDADENSIIQNSIYANGLIGIDLSINDTGSDGVTENDFDDSDSGPNQLLNFPILEVTNYTIVSATIKVNLDINNVISNLVEGYRIELFANSTNTDRGGEIYLGYLDVAGDITDAEVTVALPNEVTKDYYISATTSIITDASFVNVVPKIAFGSSSEFCMSVPIPIAEICDNGIDDDGDNLIDCADPDCENYESAGEILYGEVGCRTINPELIENVSTPYTDARETVFYQWQKSINLGVEWQDIAGANQDNYDPTTITETTLYRRLVKKHICNEWLVSNSIEKKIIPIPIANIAISPEGGDLCSEVGYEFIAEDAGESAVYLWDFGEFAQPDTSTGRGPHTVMFNGSSGNTILLEVRKGGCSRTDFTAYNIRPIIEITNVSTIQPSSCGGADGSISISVIGEMWRGVALSIDGGLMYFGENELTINNLSSGAYDLYVRYSDGECPVDAGIVNLSDPSQIIANDDYITGHCPGVLFKGNVTINDTIGENPVFSIPVDATYGRVTINETGQFTYTAITNNCGTDQFSYKICNGNTGCCATATVSVEFGDANPPIFGDLPSDITIGIDDEIPLPAEVQAFDNCPTTVVDFVENSTKNNIECSKYDYTITRTWTATDQCGNSISHIQTIEVADETAPDIFRIYTLPNGKKIIAGVMEFTSQRWKTVHLPIDFAEIPIIFTQLITNNEITPTTIRLKNVSPTQFEIRLQEEEANDSIHKKESVAWIAMESGTQIEDYQLQADTVGVTHGWSTIPFFQSFDNIPLFFTNMQTSRDEDASSLRVNGVNWNNAKVRIQEENSVDENSAHTSERIGYLAIDNIGDLANHNGEKIGEVGREKINSDWTTITLNSNYNNPVVIANSLSIEHFDPATLRIKNVTANSFDIRVEEWNYLDGDHGAETVGYMVIEGSLPLDVPNYCEDGRDVVDFSNELIALDNSNQLLEISYEEIFGFNGTEQLIMRNWFAIDICGNKGLATQKVTCPGIAMKGKALLQGALLGNVETGLMRDDLRSMGYLPLAEPYSELAGFQHVGSGGGELMREELLEIEGENAIVDWLFLELRSSLDKDIVVATASALLQRDGDIVSFKGDSLIIFASAPQSNYFIAIRHRNHIGMISNENFEFFGNNVPFIDFTDPKTTLCLNAGTSIDAQNSLWAGDLNNDGKIIYQGPNNDIFPLFLHILLDLENNKLIPNFISSGYTENDFNLDGTVIYQGPNNDRSVLLFNTILAHPDNKDFYSNFILEINSECKE